MGVGGGLPLLLHGGWQSWTCPPPLAVPRPSLVLTIPRTLLGLGPGNEGGLCVLCERGRLIGVAGVDTNGANRAEEVSWSCPSSVQAELSLFLERVNVVQHLGRSRKVGESKGACRDCTVTLQGRPTRAIRGRSGKDTGEKVHGIHIFLPTNGSAHPPTGYPT